LILFSTLSLTIEKHFCGDTLIDVAIFSESEKCATDIIKVKKIETAKESCCKDEIDVIDGLSNATTNTFDDLEDLQKQVLIAYSLSYKSLFKELPNRVISQQNYAPPELIETIYVLHETYLI